MSQQPKTPAPQPNDARPSTQTASPAGPIKPAVPSHREHGETSDVRMIATAETFVAGGSIQLIESSSKPTPAPQPIKPAQPTHEERGGGPKKRT